MNRVSHVRSKIYGYMQNEVLIHLLIIIAFLVVLDPARIHKDISDMDEIWNYQMARRVLFGQVPYRDFVMLQTPFAPQLNAAFLHILGDGLIVMRWVASLIATINGLVAFRILRKIGKSHLMAFLYSLFFLFPFLLYPKNNYSWYVVLFLSTALLLELIKIYSPTHKQLGYEVWIGISLGFTLITKQNIGLAGLFASILFLLFCSSDVSRSKMFGSLILKITGVMIVVGTELAYLGRHMDLVWLFQNMVTNLTTFAESASIPYYSLLFDSIPSALLAIAAPVFIFICSVKGLRTATTIKKKALLLFSIYAIANYCMVIPIADSIHLLYGMPISILALSAAFSNYAEDSSKQKFILSTVLILVISLGLTYKCINKDLPRSHPEIKHYANIQISKDKEVSLVEMSNFIINEEASGRTVFFLNYQAAFYLIPLDKFSYKYDTIGRGGYAEQEIIGLLASTPNATVVIRGRQGRENWQETKKIEEYVRNNMKYADSLHGFDVYRR